jgi:hypothetical protein
LSVSRRLASVAPVQGHGVVWQEGPQVKPPLTGPGHEVIDCDDAVHEWRVRQLTRQGIPWSLAQAVADHVDWHQVARLVQHGCPPRLALNIVR